MSRQEPFPESSSSPFTAPSSGVRSHRRRLSSPLSHYRNLFTHGAKRQRAKERQIIPPILYRLPGSHKRQKNRPEVASGHLPQLRPAAEDSQPLYRPDTVAYTYNFATDFATSDDIIESDATDDCSDYETPDTVDDGGFVPSQQWQAQPAPRAPPVDSTLAGLPNDVPKEWIALKQGKTMPRIIDATHEALSSALETDTSERIFSPSEWDSNSSIITSPMPCEYKKINSELGITPENMIVRQPSPQLSITPESIRRGTPRTVADDEGEEIGEPTLAVLRVLPPVQQRPRRANDPTEEIEETFVEPRQALPLPALCAPDTPVDSTELANYEDRPDVGDYGSIAEYTISDAILDLHQLMSRSFWADDDQWLVSAASPPPRGQAFTPFTNDIISTTMCLTEAIGWIKTKDGASEQARFAAAMDARVAKSMGKLRITCNTVCQHSLDRTQENLTRKMTLHAETVYRMRKFAIPRLVVLLGKVFTLLCNPASAVRELVMFIMEQVCFDTERMAKIVDIGTTTEDSDAIVASEVEEFLHSLTVVQKWAQAEREIHEQEKNTTKVIIL